MKLKKILSSALVIAMVFTMVACLIPMQASAAHSPSSGVVSKDTAQIEQIVNEAVMYNYTSAEEMLLDEYEKGYLVSVNSAGNRYSIYVNIYTGALYYVNNATGQILTSNPHDMNGASSTSAYDLLSQIVIEYEEIATSKTNVFYSSKEAALRGQIDVSYITNGLRVNYTLGDISTRYLVPIGITAARFEEAIAAPALNTLNDLFHEYFPNSQVCSSGKTDFFASNAYDGYAVYNEKGEIQQTAIKSFLTGFNTKETGVFALIASEIDGISSSAEKTAKNKQLNALKDIVQRYITFFGARFMERNEATLGGSAYQIERINTKFPLSLEGETIYEFAYKKSALKQLRDGADFIKEFCPDYTFDQLYADEDLVGYVHKSEEVKPVFRCALEYTFNDDGSLCVSLPANSIVFDETVFNLKSISPIKYFGAPERSADGYAFIPDGSGAVVEFEDFRSGNPNLVLEIYGKDFCYSTITGTHTEQITMPVYGLISGVADEAKGYFAILESGDSLANLTFNISNNYVTTYTEFEPYPSDTAVLTSAGVTTSYTMVSDSNYSGSYVTRYVMLDGENASYSGMAAYYREYLKSNGTLEALKNVNEDLPLYIEALGSVEVLEKVLSFPVNVDKALTTFDDVVTMYDRLLAARSNFADEKAKYEKMAAEAEPGTETQRLYLEKAAHYANLIDTLDNNGEIQDIKNVQFKLTGFANGGMYATYPAKVKWMKSLGGEKGLEALISAVEERDSKPGQDMAIYPEFDFMYINYTAAFDGISNKGNVSRFVDNRYASKQVYNAVTREYETMYAMVINPDALDSLYDKFVKDYSEHALKGISTSTLGSDLNSNFDDDAPVNRDQAQTRVENLLDRISSDYSVMVSAGNIYSVKYADHIVDMSIDSSHYKYSSYAVPFTGMVLHGYVNYTGSAMNYTGSPSYDLLRSIENGASIYYILGYDNTEVLKEEETLSKYYGGMFDDWYFSIVECYSYLNNAIGSLQTYEIVKHDTLIVERVATEKERLANVNALVDEFISLVDYQVEATLNAKYDDLIAEGSGFGIEVKIDIDVDSLMAFAVENCGVVLSGEENDPMAPIYDKLAASLEAIKAEYAGNADNADAMVVVFDATTLDYSSVYDLTTESFAFDIDYDTTDYTVDNHLVTMVTYENPANGDQVKFIINYNVYDVTVAIDADNYYTIGAYDYIRID